MDESLKELIGGPGQGLGTSTEFMERIFSEEEPAQEDVPTEEKAAEEPVQQDDPPAEQGDQPDDDDVEIGDSKAGEAFKRLKTELKEYKGKEKEFEQKIAMAEARAAELESKLLRAQQLTGGDDLETTLTELKKRASVLDLENTTEWEQNVAQPLEHVMKSLRRVAEAYGIEENDIHAVLMEKNMRTQGEKLEDLTMDLDSKSKRAFFQAVDDYQLIMAKKDELEQDAEKTLQLIREKDKIAMAQQKEQHWQVVSAHADSLASKMKEKLSGFEADIDGGLLGIKESLKNGISPENQAYTAISGVLLPKVYNALKKAQKEAEEYKATVDKYRAGSPANKGDGRSGSASPQKFSIKDIIDPTKPSTLLEGMFG